MSLVLYDTLTRSKKPFEPREPGKVSMYVCGPTVQAEAHIGHGRSQVVFDVLRRYLVYRGYAVLYVCNVTDIDDKIIMRAQREDVSTFEVAERYTKVWNDTMDALGILPADIQPRATGHILEMQELIQQLIDQDKAYAVEGTVFFRVREFPEYGKLSNRNIDELLEGAETVASEVKDDPLDFALWKAAKPGEPSWPAPWGEGRPGWHIECSAMAGRHLGSGFDIHGGGLDLVFPHHENEIAQYEAAHDATFARTWIHNGMIRMGEEKMSKSIGNIVALSEAIDALGPGPLRLWYLSAHHRSPLTYEDERLEEAATAHERFTTFLRTARAVAGDAEPSDAAGPHVNAFVAAMDDDLNAPKAVAVLHELVGAGNDLLKRAEAGDAAAAADVASLAGALVTLGDEVLGLDVASEVDRAQRLAGVISPIVEDLLDQRDAARSEKDFARADAIRDRLTEMGIAVEDRPGGSRWFVEPSAARRAAG